MIGYQTVGRGHRQVIVLNDWLSDTSSWQTARDYLDLEAFRWIFADLRGYGRSMDRPGQHTVAEAAGDVLALAKELGLGRFAVVGHSMSCLVALHLAQTAPERVERVVAVTPIPVAGFGNPAMSETLRSVALADDAGRMHALRGMWGEGLSDQWVRFKVTRWRATADAAAAADYSLMFSRDGLPNPKAPVLPPVLAITGEQDMEVARQAAVQGYLGALCERLTVVPIATSGHYPMQEAPPLFSTLVQRFLTQS